jgi:hypothetical protein
MNSILLICVREVLSPDPSPKERGARRADSTRSLQDHGITIGVMLKKRYYIIRYYELKRTREGQKRYPAEERSRYSGWPDGGGTEPAR